eukprot:scaffold80_cov382-Prasinococcus_capsulatus_cf.AAC.10
MRHPGAASGSVTGSPPVKWVNAKSSILQKLRSPLGPHPDGSSISSAAYTRPNPAKVSVCSVMSSQNGMR